MKTITGIERRPGRATERAFVTRLHICGLKRTRVSMSTSPSKTCQNHRKGFSEQIKARIGAYIAHSRGQRAEAGADVDGGPGQRG
jgi:hypothetical protein